MRTGKKDNRFFAECYVIEIDYPVCCYSSESEDKAISLVLRYIRECGYTINAKKTIQSMD